jgi:hypothetical protein
MHTFDNYTLGRTDDSVMIESREENRLATIRMIQQCRSSIEIISRELDPEIYDTQEFIDGIRRVILENHRARVRIIVLNPSVIIKQSHRLVNLAMELSTFIDIRKPSIEYMGFNEAMFVADGCGYIHRLKTDRYEATVNFNDTRNTRYLLGHFNEMWSKALTDMNLRKLHI